jgi:hypothetical protein
MIDGCDQTWRTGMTRREGSKRCVWRARARWVPPLPPAFPFGLLPHAAARGGGCRVKGCRWLLKRRKRTNDSHADNADVIVTNPAHQGINIDLWTRGHFDPNIKSINLLNATVLFYVLSEFVGEVGGGGGKETIESDPGYVFFWSFPIFSPCTIKGRDFQGKKKQPFPFFLLCKSPEEFDRSANFL